MSELSLPNKLWKDNLTRIVDELKLKEVLSESGGPFMPLISAVPIAQGEVGCVRIFEGGPLARIVTCSIVVPAIQLDSHMMFAFMPPESPVPHFTLDSVRAGDHCAFHLDLIPRLDLAANKAYMDEVFTPLTETLKGAREIEGLSPAQIDPRQYAIMSPWMFVSRATDAAFGLIDEPVGNYLNHWFDLVKNGISAESTADVSSADIGKRDARNRAIIFDPEVDKVWDQIGGLIGQDVGKKIRDLLKQP